MSCHLYINQRKQKKKKEESYIHIYIYIKREREKKDNMASTGPLRALTVEALTDLLASKKTDVTKQKLTEIDLVVKNLLKH